MGLPTRSRIPSGKTPTGSVRTIVRPSSRERPTLVMVAGLDMGRLYPIGEGQELLVGRDPLADIHLPDISVSRRHAYIREYNGEVLVSDLGSRNGTFVDGKRIEGEHILDRGDKIQVGALTTLKFTLADTVDIEYQQQMATAVLYDVTTGVHNRRWFEDRLAAEVAAVQRHGGVMSLLIIDIDLFRTVNNLHGHVAGDAVLRTVANALAKQMRREDMLARFGGEEFVLIARGSNLEGAEILAERLRAKVEQSVCRFEDLELQVTISIGVAELSVGSTVEQLLEAADAALYRAKHRGRNQVVSLRY